MTIDYNNLLKGRYSFGFHGESAFSDLGPTPISVVGSIVFDGQGNVVSAKYFVTGNGFTERVGRSTDPAQFVSGTYAVNNTEVGQIGLHFSDPRYYEGSDRRLNLDIALTNGGKGFYINVHKAVIVPNDTNIDPIELYWTANGQAAQE